MIEFLKEIAFYLGAGLLLAIAWNIVKYVAVRIADAIFLGYVTHISKDFTFSLHAMVDSHSIVPADLEYEVRFLQEFRARLESLAFPNASRAKRLIAPVAAAMAKMEQLQLDTGLSDASDTSCEKQNG